MYNMYVHRNMVQLQYLHILLNNIHRTNDDDDKLVIANKEYSDDAINALTEFQEQYFEHEILRGETKTR